jgi:futalosine hydrolase
LTKFLPGPLHRGVIATVATCSGTDALAVEVERRTGAIAEAMEGAAVVHAALRLGLPGGEVRVISNSTGDRAKQQWDIARAFAAMHTLGARFDQLLQG